MAMTPAGMVAKIKAARASLPTSDGSAGQAAAQADAMLLALCTGILNEITANSELVPVSTDSGTAGAGIITGKVK
jgi:hypothetical protein